MNNTVNIQFFIPDEGGSQFVDFETLSLGLFVAREICVKAERVREWIQEIFLTFSERVHTIRFEIVLSNLAFGKTNVIALYDHTNRMRVSFDKSSQFTAILGGTSEGEKIVNGILNWLRIVLAHRAKILVQEYARAASLAEFISSSSPGTVEVSNELRHELGLRPPEKGQFDQPYHVTNTTPLSALLKLTP